MTEKAGVVEMHTQLAAGRDGQGAEGCGVCLCLASVHISERVENGEAGHIGRSVVD